ncbi:MAG: sulfurtransferase [Acaryochloridaceae cyanobacterium RU_4_10]|nr:sulfurtransferase [Acaryochloridaceae cyanobacterium RU_4_10]
MANVLVSPDWIADHQEDTDFVVVDCRFSLADLQLGHQQYLQGHIPGAYYLDLNQDLASPVRQHGGRHPLPDLSTLAGKLSRMGVTAQTLVVAYDDSRFAFASRLWWLLKYMGHDRIAVLDGGFAAYQSAGFPITTELPTEREGLFAPQIRSELVVNLHDVIQRQQDPSAKIVDSREVARYQGKSEPIDPIAGHIPGAVNYPWQEVTDERGWMRSSEELQEYWSEVLNADEVVVYCGSGVTACVNLLALEVAGLPTAKLYVGSWSDWCSYPLDEHWQVKID